MRPDLQAPALTPHGFHAEPEPADTEPKIFV